jgi:hypothetical protein
MGKQVEQRLGSALVTHPGHGRAATAETFQLVGSVLIH